MRRLAISVPLAALACALVAGPRHARADEPADPDAVGVAVVAEGDGSADLAWPLAQAAYAKAGLRPRSLTEAEARALAGEAPAEDAPANVKELSQLRHAVQGEDTVSREILWNVGRRTHTKAILVLAPQKDAPPQVRLYDVAKKTFDAARWQPEGKEGAYTWDGAVTSIERTLAPPPAPVAVAKAPALVLAPATPAKDKTKSFYESPWFWVAIGSAALLGGGIFLATRDWSGDLVHVRMQVPQ